MLLPLRLLSRWTISACPGRLSPLPAPQLLRTCLPGWGPRTSCPQHPSPSWSYLHRVTAICHRPSEYHTGELRSSPDSLRGPRLRPLPSPLRGSTPISPLSINRSPPKHSYLHPYPVVILRSPNQAGVRWHLQISTGPRLLAKGVGVLSLGTGTSRGQ